MICFHQRKTFYGIVFFHYGILFLQVFTFPLPDRNITEMKNKPDVVSSTDGLHYLQQFGYMKLDNNVMASLRTPDAVTEALKEFQRFAGITQTGILDNATQYMMKLPRCGNPDITEHNHNRYRRKRYALQGSKWSKTDLTFKISEYPSGISRDRAEKEVHKALQTWGDVSPINFILRPFDDKVDINVKFARRSHGDGNPFDGRGKTLAHAFFPQYGGDAHFDDDEDWSISSLSGINMFQVAAHEFGHSLGLSHSDVGSALMAPFYRGYQKQFELDQDDINAIQELYGVPNSDMTKKVWRPPPVVDPHPTKGPALRLPVICLDSNVDAVTTSSDGFTYIFKGDEYYKLNNYGIAHGYPRKIETDWKGLKGPIDSALHWDNGYTYIFKGNYYWKFYNFNLIYVRSISEGFKGIPNDIDAAFVWSGNGKTYFIKGKEYWRYTVNHVDPGYPKPLSVWIGLPQRVDAALKWKNGRTYFFHGDLYYRYNDVNFNIDMTYPRTISNWWLGCPDREQIIQITGNEIKHRQPFLNSPDNLPKSHAIPRDLGQLKTGNIQTEADELNQQFLEVDPVEKRLMENLSLKTTKNAPNIIETKIVSAAASNIFRKNFIFSITLSLFCLLCFINLSSFS